MRGALSGGAPPFHPAVACRGQRLFGRSGTKSRHGGQVRAISAYRSPVTGLPHNSAPALSGSRRRANTRGRTAVHGGDQRPGSVDVRCAAVAGVPQRGRGVGQGPQQVPAEDDAVPAGGAAASPTRNRPSRPAAVSFARTRSTIRGARSTPLTRCPAPAPPPTSSRPTSSHRRRPRAQLRRNAPRRRPREPTPAPPPRPVATGRGRGVAAGRGVGRRPGGWPQARAAGRAVGRATGRGGWPQARRWP